MRVAYILSRYPTLTETFVREEMLTLLAEGVDLRVYPLRGPQDTAWVLADQPDGGISKRVRRYGFALSPANLGACVRELMRSPARFQRACACLFRCNPVGVASAAKALFMLPKLCRIAADLRAWGPAHIHAHFANLPAASAAFVGQLLRQPSSFTAHAFDIYSRDRASLGRLISGVDFAVTISERNREYLVAGLPPGVQERVHVIHCGVDTDSFGAVPPAEGPFLAVGRLVPKKGFHLLIEAMARLRDDGIGARCEIIGEGPQRAELEALVARHDLAAHVTLSGPRPTPAVRAALAGAAAFVLPCVEAPDGDIDGIPVSLMEAMSMAKPVVTTEISGITELVTDRVNGILVPSGDVPALAAALADLRAGRFDVTGLGRAARTTVIARFDSRVNARRLLDLMADREFPR